MDCPFNPKTNRDLSVLKKLLMLHQTCGLAQPSIGKTFLTGVEIFCLQCGKVLSLVLKFFIPGVEFFCFRSYPTIEMKNVGNRDKLFPHQRQKISTQVWKVFIFVPILQ